VSVDVQRKGNGFKFLILLLVIYINVCYVHLRLVSAVESNIAGEHCLNVMACNRTVALIFQKQGFYNGMNVNAAFTQCDVNL
jgi:hypothetical protein